MKIAIKNFKENPSVSLRRAGYVFLGNENNEMSFVKRLGGADYPRFHIYAKAEENALTINIHLDQKRGTYGAARHHGEYENSAELSAEAERIKNILI
ncbi:MAG: hypothetical protein PHC85_02950 [Candidatus Pacebacteria bacterium]|nr:hypothetical protein [Candidatus Paceibacterota bacterium]